VGGDVATLSGNSFSKNVTLANQGDNYVSVVATDNVGNQTATVATIILDSVPPTLTITPDSTLTNASVMTYTINTSDETSGVTRVTGDTNNTTIYAPQAVNVIQESLSEGVNILTWTAKDDFSNSTTVSVTVTRDSVPPIANVTFCEGITNIDTCELIVSNTLDSGSGLDRIEFGVNGESFGSPVTWGSGSIVFSGMVGGNNTLIATVYDLAGNARSYFHYILYDSHTPTLGSEAVESQYGAPIGYISIIGTCSNLSQNGRKTAIERLVVKGVEASGCSNGGWVINIEESSLVAGINTMTGTIRDEAGNESTQTITFNWIP
jgi:hypothetical protein